MACADLLEDLPREPVHLLCSLPRPQDLHYLLLPAYLHDAYVPLYLYLRYLPHRSLGDRNFPRLRVPMPASKGLLGQERRCQML